MSVSIQPTVFRSFQSSLADGSGRRARNSFDYPTSRTCGKERKSSPASSCRGHRSTPGPVRWISPSVSNGAAMHSKTTRIRTCTPTTLLALTCTRRRSVPKRLPKFTRRRSCRFCLATPGQSTWGSRLARAPVQPVGREISRGIGKHSRTAGAGAEVASAPRVIPPRSSLPCGRSVPSAVRSSSPASRSRLPRRRPHPVCSCRRPVPCTP